jgi:hypothetical protein
MNYKNYRLDFGGYAKNVSNQTKDAERTTNKSEGLDGHYACGVSRIESIMHRSHIISIGITLNLLPTV